MTRVTCRLTAKNRDQLRNPTLGNLVWTTFTLSCKTRTKTRVLATTVRVCVCVCVLSCVCECVTVCRCRVVQSVGSVRVSVCVSVCDVRRPGVQVVAQLVVLEMSEQVLANVLERAVPRVRPPPGVRCRHDRRRLCDEHTVVTIMSRTPCNQWRRQGGSFSLWVDVQKLCNMCAFHCHGTSSYHTTNTLQGHRAKSHVDTQTIQPGLGDFVL